jgi:hypothetical protein
LWRAQLCTIKSVHARCSDYKNEVKARGGAGDMSTRAPATTEGVGSWVLNRGDHFTLHFLMQGERLGSYAILDMMDAQRGVFRTFREVEMVVVSGHTYGRAGHRLADGKLSRRNGSGTHK